MKIEVGDVIYSPGFGVGYVTKVERNTNDLTAMFPWLMKAYDFSPTDDRITRIAKHRNIKYGDFVYCGRLGFGHVVDDVNENVIKVNFNSANTVLEYNRDGTVRGFPFCSGTHSDYRLFLVREPFVKFEQDKNDKDSIIREIIGQLTTLLD